MSGLSSKTGHNDSRESSTIAGAHDRTELDTFLRFLVLFVVFVAQQSELVEGRV
jgi:hypothetical protein